MSPFLSENLNAVQAQAANKVDGPLLLLAGAGSGKTRVLTYRIANLIASGKARPDEILAVTFTNKAAREMEARTLGLLQRLDIAVFEPLWISTFHSTCARILRDQLYLLDYKPGWGIYDSSDQLSVIKKILRSLGIKDKEFPAKNVQSRINHAKMLGLEPYQVEKQSGFIMDDQTFEVYEIYESELKKANCVDFGDLLLKTHILFKDYPDILEQYQNRFRYIMVDEYQDTNHIQYLLVKTLAQKHQNLCVVGDEDQSIYSWRGADITNILNFEQDFPDSEVIKLEENYRSTNVIVSSAQAVIKNNTQRKDKTLYTNNDDGDKITVSEQGNEYDEARYIATEIKKHAESAKFSYSEIAVFYRTNAQSRVIEEQLRGYSIPYRMVGGTKFYERKEIKDVISYLKLSVNPSDDISLKRAINTPARGIGKTTIEKLENLATDRKTSIFEIIEIAAQEKIVHSGAAKKLILFKALVQDLINEKDSHPVTEFYQLVLEKSSLIERLRVEDTVEADNRIENLEEFYNAISQFEKERGEEANLVKFLEELALISDADDIDMEASAVTLMTLHISKGLEYPCVFIGGLEEGLFPSGQSVNKNDLALEEERRLAYVGMTRAEKKLYLTHARKRRVWGTEQFNPPSRFLIEIPEQYLDSRSKIKKPSFMDRYGSTDYNQSSSYDTLHDPFPDYEMSEGFDDVYQEEYSEESDSFSKGMRVMHPSYGHGSIFKVEGMGETQKVSVLFQDQTIKKFVAKFARLERV